MKYVKLIALTIVACMIIFYKKTLVLMMILGGYFVSPEASDILTHYCFGSGDTLYLDSSYIKRSPVIKREISKLKVGDAVERVGFEQKDDWRLSYALNPFKIKRTREGYEIYQWIEFDQTGKVPTELNLGITTITVNDAVVHAFDCKPFWVICKFKNPELN